MNSIDMKEDYMMEGILARWRTAGVILSLAAFSLLLLSAACAPAAQDDTTSTTDTTETTEHQDDDGHDEDALASGQVLFGEKGCAACHGADGEGTEIAPGMGGHSETQVLRQVRAPVGIMPPFSTDQISDEELASISSYITSLSGGHHHGGGSTSDTPAANIQHHWMALFALEDGNVEQAEHHITHIIELTEGVHQQKMNEALTALQTGATHDAEHIIQEMLSGVAEVDLTRHTMHLKMALSSLIVDQVDDANHHLEHAIDSADPTARTVLEEIKGLIAGGDHESADHELRELLGDDAPAGDAHTEGEDAHGGGAHAEEEVHDEATSTHDETPHTH